MRNGSKATYAKLIKIFEHAGYKSYADEVRKIAHISNSDTDDSSSSEKEEHPQIEQPQTYPEYKPHVLPQVPHPATSTESTEIYVMVKEENLPKGKQLVTWYKTIIVIVLIIAYGQLLLQAAVV